MTWLCPFFFRHESPFHVHKLLYWPCGIHGWLHRDMEKNKVAGKRKYTTFLCQFFLRPCRILHNTKIKLSCSQKKEGKYGRKKTLRWQVKGKSRQGIGKSLQGKGKNLQSKGKIWQGKGKSWQVKGKSWQGKGKRRQEIGKNVYRELAKKSTGNWQKSTGKRQKSTVRETDTQQDKWWRGNTVDIRKMVLCQGLPHFLRLRVDPCMARHLEAF